MFKGNHFCAAPSRQANFYFDPASGARLNVSGDSEFAAMRAVFRDAVAEAERRADDAEERARKEHDAYAASRVAFARCEADLRAAAKRAELAAADATARAGACFT